MMRFLLPERRWLTMNDITTGQTPEYPDLPSRVYAADVARWRKVIADANIELK